MDQLKLRMARRVTWGSLAVIAAISGCGPVGKMELVTGPLIKGHEAGIKKVAADPMALLRESLAKTRTLSQYSMAFERQERLGIIPQLRPAEHILAEYRDDPFSVRFTWKDAGSEYVQCVYVAGKNDGKVAILPRKGAMGAAPTVQNYPANWAMLFQKARNPITDFGPRRMMERIIDRIEKAKKHGEVEITILEPKEIGPAREPCYHLELRYPKGDQYACKLQDLYIHMDKLWPVATYLWLPGKAGRAESTLDAMYVYASLNPLAEVTDASFVLDKPAGTKRAKVVTAGEVEGGKKSKSEQEDSE